jgi:hypothetical protein
MQVSSVSSGDLMSERDMTTPSSRAFMAAAVTVVTCMLGMNLGVLFFFLSFFFLSFFFQFHKFKTHASLLKVLLSPPTR